MSDIQRKVYYSTHIMPTPVSHPACHPGSLCLHMHIGFTYATRNMDVSHWGSVPYRKALEWKLRIMDRFSSCITCPLPLALSLLYSHFSCLQTNQQVSHSSRSSHRYIYQKKRTGKCSPGQKSSAPDPFKTGLSTLSLHRRIRRGIESHSSTIIKFHQLPTHQILTGPQAPN